MTGHNVATLGGCELNTTLPLGGAEPKRRGVCGSETSHRNTQGTASFLSHDLPRGHCVEFSGKADTFRSKGPAIYLALSKELKVPLVSTVPGLIAGDCFARLQKKATSKNCWSLLMFSRRSLNFSSSCRRLRSPCSESRLKRLGRHQPKGCDTSRTQAELQGKESMLHRRVPGGS